MSRDDLFGDDFDFDDDDDFDFNDDFAEDSLSDLDDGDDFSFDDDDEFDFGEDDDFDDLSFGTDDDDIFVDEGEGDEGGASRTFIILAGIMIVLFIAGLVAVLLLALNDDDGPTPFEQTSEAIVLTNNAIGTEVAAVDTQVADADATNAVLQVTLEFEATETAIANAEAISGTETALALEATQAAVDATSTAEAAGAQATADAQATSIQQTADANDQPTDEVTPDETEDTTPEAGSTASENEVALTATALAEVFLSLTPGGDDPTPTAQGGTGGVDFATQPPGQLPQTGLFDGDDSASNIGIIALMAFGLVGIIFGARRLRAANTV